MKPKTPFADLPDNRALKIASDIRMRLPELDVKTELSPGRNRIVIKQQANTIDQFNLKPLVDFCNRRGFYFAVYAFPSIPVLTASSVKLTFEIF